MLRIDYDGFTSLADFIKAKKHYGAQAALYLSKNGLETITKYTDKALSETQLFTMFFIGKDALHFVKGRLGPNVVPENQVGTALESVFIKNVEAQADIDELIMSQLISLKYSNALIYTNMSDTSR